MANFATTDMLTDRLKTLGATAKSAAVTRYMTYAHAKVTSIMAGYGIDASTITDSVTNYELLQHGEADIAAGYCYQAGPPSTDDHVYTDVNPHIMVSTGIANIIQWCEDYLEETTENARFRVTNRTISARDTDFQTNNYP